MKNTSNFIGETKYYKNKSNFPGEKTLTYIVDHLQEQVGFSRRVFFKFSQQYSIFVRFADVLKSRDVLKSSDNFFELSFTYPRFLSRFKIKGHPQIKGQIFPQRICQIYASFNLATIFR